MSRHACDSLIFDMDGTLWDAVDSYCHVWDYTINETGLSRGPVTRDELVGLMGQPLERIVEVIVPDVEDKADFLRRLDANEDRLMPQLGGRLFPGVKETIEALSHEYPLFMVSNCSPNGLHNFMEWAGLTDCFTDSLSHGETGCGKDVNIRRLVDRYGLKLPLYVGDTQSDADACRRAGVPIAWASYGFGRIGRPDIVLDTFADLPSKIYKP